jgi:DUF2075 family protein
VISVSTSAVPDVPKGAPFLIDRCPFRPGQGIEYAALDIPDDKVFNWPMVYILSNKDEAYVGQTTSVVSRMSQHGANREKRAFDTANIIYNEEFNASVITDYEHRLIDYLHADGRYTLTNKNDGMTDTNYFSKAVYEDMFRDLWDQLRRLDLAQHTIAEIEESEVFKYSPFKGLTTDQRVALDKILASIDAGLDSSQPIVVEGYPGTGKTVLAIYLLKTLRDDPRYKGLNIRILEPVTSLRKTLRSALKGVSGLRASDIIGPSDLANPKSGYVPGREKCFDIVLVDEAHKLKRRVNLGTQFGNYDNVNRKLHLPEEATQLDWVLDQAKLPIFFYDPLQSIGPACIEPLAMKRALGTVADREPIRLQTQMRVQGGNAYLGYIQRVLDGTQDGFRAFDGYDFVLHDDFSDFVAAFERDYQKHNLSRMIAGYAWKWVSRKDSSAFDIEIDGIGLKWNRTQNNWVGLGVDNPQVAHEVGCIHSIQGYDLSYAYVIIGNDFVLSADGAPASNKSSYFDRNGKVTASTEELDRFIKNIYYVLLTRGILGTHVYVCDPALRDYFARYIPQAS